MAGIERLHAAARRSASSVILFATAGMRCLSVESRLSVFIALNSSLQNVIRTLLLHGLCDAPDCVRCNIELALQSMFSVLQVIACSFELTKNQ